MITAHQCAHLADDRKKLGAQNSIYFNGTNAKAVTTYSEKALPTGYASVHSVALRYYAPIVNNLYYVAANTTYSVITSLFAILVQNPGQVYYYSGNGSSYNKRYTGLYVNLNAWNDIIVRVNSSNQVIVQVNGNTYGPSTLTYTPTNQGDPVAFMYTPTGAPVRYLPGKIKDFTFWLRDIDSEGANQFAAGGIPSHPSIYLPGNEGIGEWKDHSRHRAPTTITNGVWQYTDPDDGRIWI